MKSLREIGAHASAAMRDGGISQLVPLPVWRGPQLRAAVLEYRQSGEPRGESVYYPPYRLLVLDTETAALISISSIAPREAGPDWPLDKPLPTMHLPRATSMADWHAKRDRLDVLAPIVWEAFARKAPQLDPASGAMVTEYIGLSESTEPDALWPYMRETARHFYDWARRVGALAAP